MTDNTYNGWKGNGDKASAYATWRVALEIFDGRHAYDVAMDCDTLQEAIDRVSPEALEELVEVIVFHEESDACDTLMESYARAFLSDVNYYEISDHMEDELRENYVEWDLENEKDSECHCGEPIPDEDWVNGRWVAIQFCSEECRQSTLTNHPGEVIRGAVQETKKEDTA